MAPEKKSSNVGFFACPDCAGSGLRQGRACASCRGVGVFWVSANGSKFFWGEPIHGGSPGAHQLKVKLRRLAGALGSVVTVFLVLFGLYFFFWRNFTLSVAWMEELPMSADSAWVPVRLFTDVGHGLLKAARIAWTERSGEALVFWLGVGVWMIFRYFRHTWQGARKIINPTAPVVRSVWDPTARPLGQAEDVAAYAAPQTLELLRTALSLAYGQGVYPTVFHVSLSLLKESDLAQVFARAEINLAEWEKFLREQIAQSAQEPLTPHQKIRGEVELTPALKAFLIRAWLEACGLGFKRIELEALVVALLAEPQMAEFFYLHKLEVEDMRVLALWASGWKEIQWTEADGRARRKRVTNRAWTARVTPDLDRFSYDLTAMARAGELGYVIKRERELAELMRVLERKGGNNALLLGDEGSGRDSIVKALANLMVRDEVLPTLQDKRLVVLEISALVAGASVGGELELRLNRLIADLAGSANIILYIPDLHNLTVAGGEQGFDAAKVLSPILAAANFQVIGSTDFANYHRYLEPRTDLTNSFEIVRVEELSDEETMKVLAISAGVIERREQVTITFRALKSALQLSKRYINNRLLPGKAVDLLAETAVEVKRRGVAVVREEDIAAVVTEKTGIPISAVEEGEAVKLLHLEESLHRRVVGQENAVREVAGALRRARVGMKRSNRPVGAFLFLGPTGVGKTELAKALAEVYFGSEQAMIRLDMSEYQTVESVEKILGSDEVLPETSRGGYLTEAVKHRPFSLILLDEIEKAHRQVLNIFLQVMDDGRLTDSLGRTVDFTNTIIIATSNVGSEQIIRVFVNETNNRQILEMLSPYILEHFSPEFLNRFTAQIVFHSLAEADIQQILLFQLNKLAANLEEAQGVKLMLEAGALSYLAKIGYSAEYGARHLERTLQEKLENLIAVKVLSGAVKRGETLRVSAEDLSNI